MTPAPHLARGLGWIVVTILCWVPLFPIAKRALPIVDAFAMGSIRYAIGGTLLVCLLVALEGRKALRYDGRLLPAVVLGVIGITGFNALVWYGLTFTRPEHAAIIMGIQTPLIALGVWVTRGVRPAGFTLACTAIAFCGVLLVVTRGDPMHAFEGGALVGDLLVFLGALSWVTYTLASARFSGWSPIRFTVLTCLPGGLGLVAVNAVAISAGIATVPTMQALGTIAWQILYFAVGTVVLGVLGFNFSVKYLGPLNTMLMLNLVPVGVFAIEASLGRSFTAAEIGGASLVIGALVANNLYLRRAAAKRSSS
ncbi:MAG TPA: DMT family transporter [Burkholderiales bacterium]|nr:DMT family transporter [Burkholderiales bacterium]